MVFYVNSDIISTDIEIARFKIDYIIFYVTSLSVIYDVDSENNNIYAGYV